MQTIYYNSPGGVIGLNTTSTTPFVGVGNGPPFCSQIIAAVGDEYLIMINNFGNYVNSSGVSGFTLDFTGSSATFDQGPLPVFTGVKTQCDYSATVTVLLNKPVKCSSIAADNSDFTLTPSGTISTVTGIGCTLPSSYTSSIKIDFATPLPAGAYQINAQQGTDANTLIDMCNNQLALPASAPFTVSPNTLSMVSIDTPACNKVRIIFSDKINCATVAPDGTDFEVTQPGSVSVIKALPQGCNSYNATDTVNVYFSGSILVPGTYTIKTKTGSDNNSVLDTCGRPVVNTLSWVVSDRGYVTANAVPNLLCEPGYIDLTSSRTSNNPPGISNCGPASSVAPLPSSNVQVGSSLTGTAVYPFTSFWMDGRTQILFPLADLVSQGFTKKVPLLL